MTSISKTVLAGFAARCVLALLVLGLAGCSDDPADGDKSPEENATSGTNEPGDTDPSDAPPAKNSTEGYPNHVLAALEKAADEDKIVMVELHDPTCKTCEDMDRAVFSKEVVKTILDEMIHVKIGPDDSAMIEKFGLSLIPSFLFFKSDGTPLPPMLEGYRPSRRLAKELANFKLVASGQPAEELGTERHPQFGKG